MEAWIAFFGLLSLLMLSAIQRKRIPPPRDVALEDEALSAHLQAEASAHRALGSARLHGARRSARRLRHALSALDALRATAPEAAHELLPGAQWLADNARTLEDSALALARELPRVQPVPMCGGQPRVERLARELVSHSDAKLHSANVRSAVEAWQSVHLMRLRELYALPLALRATLMELISHLAVACADAQRDRAAAEEWARLLSQSDPQTLMRRFARAPRSTCFFEHLLKCLRDQENAAALSWLDKQLDALDLRAQRVVEREHARQTLERQWISNAIISLRTLGQIHWNELLESLSTVESWLREDPSGVYPRMDTPSRAMYRGRVERIARTASLSEIQVARNAYELAEAADTEDESQLAVLKRHVGYYLLDDGQPALWRRMGGTPMAAALWLWVGRHAAPLYVAARIVCTLLFCSIALRLGLAFSLLPLALFPLSAGASALLHYLLRKLCPPRILPRIAYEELPVGRRTLIAVPTLLSRPEQARQMMRHLSVLQRANPDPNLHYLLLADYPDGPAAQQAEDADITHAALDAAQKLNEERPGTFLYLHRQRVWNDAQRKFMGTERKRGALAALNELLLTGKSDDPFSAASFDPSALQGRYDQVITLDSDTLLPPGSALELIGMLTHPLNAPIREGDTLRGRAVIQPRMEMTAHSARTRIARVFGGDGGIDPYLTATSDVYQDLCGRGSFAGKGIYDVRAFYEATHGLLRPNTILSHDLIEGELSGSALASDVALYDSQPGSLRSWMMRLHRWTRGDWQLLPWLFPIVRAAEGRRKNPLDALSRYKIWDNLRRSLVPLTRVLLLLLGTMRHDMMAVTAALLLPELPLLLSPSWHALRAAGIQLALLPYQAYTLTDAALRTVWRVCFSRQHLLDWVTAADAERRDAQKETAYPLLKPACFACAGALLACSFFSIWLFPLALLLGAAWCFAPQVAEWLDAPIALPEPLSDPDRQSLEALARDTWRFFERAVTADDNHLPPDNLQLQPDRGLAHRTSPTNIGLYLLSCVSAQRLGFLEPDEMARRVEATLYNLEKLETWNGHLLNWYDTRTLATLHPRYVSSVDSGNLAGCLLTCAQALREARDSLDPTHHALPVRLEALWEAMDFSAVYDAQCDLFYIGVHPETGRAGESHYDLLASEARLLSFLALMRGAVPMRHWQRLGRSLLRVGKGAALASWSGTMFEYLMPAIMLRLTPGTLLADTCRQAALAQRDAAGGRPWGISESGYYAFDPMLNYQYRAFGLPKLALRNEDFAPVIAPYATALALMVLPADACENLLRMQRMGWSGELGFYEAADYTAPGSDAPYQLVRSHMAHHQGMALCALCNLLTENSLQRTFHARPEIEAYELLLEERTPARHALHWHTHSTRRTDAPIRRPLRAIRNVQPETIPVETQLLYGEGTTLLCDARGGGYIAHNGLMLTRWRPNPLANGYGMQIYLFDAESGTAWRAAQSGLPGETRFETGSAIFQREQGEVYSKLQCCVCPLDGAALHLLTLSNRSERERTLSVASFFEVALSAQNADVAHPAFRNLFIQTERIGGNAAIAQRRPRTPQERFPLLLHAAASDAPGLRWTVHTDRARFLGREHGHILPRALRTADLEDSTGAVVDPCMSAGTQVTLPAGGSIEIAFVTMAAATMEEAAQSAAVYAELGAAHRVLELAQTQAQVTVDYLSMDPSAQHQAHRLASYMLYAGQGMRRTQPPAARFAREDLWACGLSGDLPILTLCVREPAHLPLARAVFKIHEAWRQWGLWADLVLLDDHGGDYYPPTRSALQEMVASGHARDLVGKPGGVHFLDAQVIQPPRCAALLATSALVLRGEDGALGAQMKALRTGIPPAQSVWPASPRSWPQTELPPLERLLFNGWGGFTRAGEYAIDLLPGAPTPAPWCNVLANPAFGCILSERGAGFTYARSSHGGRLTPWMNDPVRTRTGEALYLRDEQTGQFDCLLPHARRVTHAPGCTTFEGEALGVAWRATVFVDAQESLKHTLLSLRNPGAEARALSVTAYAAWVLGEQEGMRHNRAALILEHGLCTAQGPSLPGVAFLAMPGARAAQGSIDRAAFLGLGGAGNPRGMRLPSLDDLGTDDACAVLRAPVALEAGGEASVHLLLGWAEDEAAALSIAQRMRDAAIHRLDMVRDMWAARLARLALRTPDEAFDGMVNRWLPYQLTASRLWARSGFYQAGGAFGFRDQLQDTLALLYTDPAAVRAHLLLCAAHQFEAGDVQHWWHPPARGVRTRITDDLLFLPFVTAAYVRATGDTGVLREEIPYLQNVDIPAGQEDWYGNAQPAEQRGTLRAHCLAAVRHTKFGEHGIPLMGGGDWNDALNRVGIEGKGESVWLGWFFAETLRAFAPLCEADDREELFALRAQVLDNLETHAWDGAWYRRAWFDDGSPLGTAGDSACEIDCIAQSWAVLAGARPERAKQAMDALWEKLIDPAYGVARLLTPSFDRYPRDPGYIQGYLPGIRENGGQYTHGATWAVQAFAKLGQVERAWALLRMLLPLSHSDTPEAAARYRVEPYVSVADVYANPQQMGRGGWTWYTGSASWLWMAAAQTLLGFEKAGSRLRLAPLLPAGWDAISCAYTHGESGTLYRISARRDAAFVTLDGRRAPEDWAGWIELAEDGKTHEAVFPVR